MPDAGRLGDVPQVGDQTVGDVDHRLRTRGRGRRALAVGRLGHQMTTTQFVESVDSLVPTTNIPQPSGPAHPPRQAPNPAFAPDRNTGGAAVQLAEHRHRHHPLRAADQIASDDAGTDAARLVPHSVDQRVHLGCRGVAGRAEARPRKPRRRAPIASMSAAFWAIALRPTSCGVDQSSRKCRSCTSMSVDTTVRPSPAGHHRRVVAGSERHRGGLAASAHQAIDDGELTDLPQRRPTLRMRLRARHLLLRPAAGKLGSCLREQTAPVYCEGTVRPVRIPTWAGRRAAC